MNQVIEGEDFVAVMPVDPLGSDSDSLVKYNRKRLAKAPNLGELIERQNAKQQTPFQQELERTKTSIEFSKYVDNTMRLYKQDSILSDIPAGYSEERVSVKILVKRPSEEFLVVIKTTRHNLDLPGAEETLAIAAYNWRKG